MDRITKPIYLSEWIPDFQIELVAHMQDVVFVASDLNEALRIMQEMGCRWLRTFYPEETAMLKIWGWKR